MGGLALGAVLALALIGCQQGSILARPGVWPYAPATLRIHPLTHVAAPRMNAPMPGYSPAVASAGVLEVFIELLDVDGFDTRGVGSLAVTVTPRGDASLPTLSWTVDLEDPSTNRRYFDWVTRTYRLPLVLEWPGPPRSRALAVEAVLSIDGVGELRSASEVRWLDDQPQS